jgi:hypothetical protein
LEQKFNWDLTLKSPTPSSLAKNDLDAPANSAPGAFLAFKDQKQEASSSANKPAEPTQIQRFANATTDQSSIAGLGGAALARNDKAANTQQKNAFANQTLQIRSKTKQSSNVMSSFDIEQTGNRIRVIDADGSTYTGELKADSQPIAGTIGKQRLANQAVDRLEKNQTGQSASNAFRFRAVGSNLTLNKAVVFEGTYFVPAQQNQQANNLNSQLQTPSRIIGVAKVRGEPEIEVDAVPVQ